MSNNLVGKNPLNNTYDYVGVSDNAMHVAQYVWDTNTLSWIRQAGSTGVGSDVTVTNFPATQVVSDGGSSLTVDGTVSVTGTFWQATQPVSIASPVAVTGTFWQATQPVSGPLTDTQLRATPVPVSGTFWQTTQPVSGTVTANAGTGTFAVSGPLTDAQLRATAVPVSGTFWQATQPVSIAKPATPSQTSPSVTNASTAILSANASRLGATIWNEGAAICYLKLGTTASTTSYSVQIASGGYYEVPFGYTGVIQGITSSGTAQLRVTELT